MSAEWITDRSIARLREEWAKGSSTSAIGELLGTSKNAIVGKAHRIGLPERPNPGGADGGFPWDFASIEQLRSLCAAGKSWVAIGRILDASPNAVRYKAQSLGLPHPSVKALAANARTLPRLASAERPTAAIERPSWAAPSRTPSRPPPMHAAPSRPPPAPIEPYVRIEPCCWVVQDAHAGKLPVYCDKPSAPGRPYCPGHSARAYVRTGRQQAANAATMGGD